MWQVRSMDVALKWYAMWPEEIGELHRLALMMPMNPRVVNVGSGPGTSVMAIIEVRPDATVWSVDVAKSELERANLTEAGMMDRVTQLGGRSVPEAAAWNGGQVDMTFIDAGHDYQNCHDDIVAWSKHLKTFGIMACHDFNKATCPGVVEAVMELLGKDTDNWDLIGHVTSLISFRKLR